MSRLAGLILLLVLAPALCADEQADEIAAQIAKLGDKQWSVREKAQRRLVAIGEPAREKLREALVHEDLEVRSRASAALVAIGESFDFALACAQDKAEGKREHGQAALLNLFKLDSEETLTRFTNENGNRYYNYYYRRPRENTSLTAPPQIAIATFEAVSGLPLLVAAPAKASWATLLQAATVSLDNNESLEQPMMAAAQVNQLMYRVLGNPDFNNSARPVALPMRIGQVNFILITSAGASNDAPRGAATQLLADFIAGGITGVRAARLLAAGLSGDPVAQRRLVEQFSTQNATQLALVALHAELGPDIRKRVLEAARGQLDALLASRDWVGLTVAATLLQMLEPGERAARLDPIIAATQDSLALEVALYCAAGCELSAPARARVLKCVSNRQDGLAACAARWIAGAKTVSDEELSLVWKSAEIVPTTSAFFAPALELISRDDVRPRLFERARKALAGQSETQQALAAAVLTGNATAADLAVVVDKLRNMPNVLLAGKLCKLFAGASELQDAAIDKLAAGLLGTDSDIAKRRRFARALRQCKAELQLKVIATAEKKWSDLSEQAAGSIGVRAAKLMLLGMKAGHGDETALNEVMAALNAAEPEIIKAGAAALVDALDSDGLASTLAALKKKNPGKQVEVATAAYLEQCRRAVEESNTEKFRAAASRVNALQAMGWNWQIMQELAQMDGELTMGVETKNSALLPKNPGLNSLTVDPK